MTVRHLGPGDEDTLRAAAIGQYGRVASPEWLTALLDDPAVLAVAAIEDENPVGFAYGYLLPRVKDDALGFLLYEIDVSPDHRRKGHGKAMVTALGAWAAECGADTSWLLTDDGNPAALALYASAGGERDPVDQVMFRFRGA